MYVHMYMYVVAWMNDSHVFTSAVPKMKFEMTNGRQHGTTRPRKSLF